MQEAKGEINNQFLITGFSMTFSFLPILQGLDD